MIFLINVIFFAISFGQETLIKRNDILDFLPPIKNQVATLRPVINWGGFQYKQIEFNNFENCEKLEFYDLFFAIFYSAKFSLDNQWEEVLKKCSFKIKSNMMELLSIHTDSNSLEEFLIIRKKISSAYRQRL